MKKEDFEKIVREGINQIPEKFLKKIENVEIVIEDEPDSHQLENLKKSRGTRLLGLYQGVPQTKRYHYSEVLPDKITIFQKSIEEIARSRRGPASPAKRGERGSPRAAEDEIREIVKSTVWHEIAHHFGMTEEQIKKAENRRKKTA